MAYEWDSYTWNGEISIHEYIRINMSDDKQEEQTESPQRDFHETHAGQIDSSLRTDRNYIGLHVAIVLLIISVLMHLFGEYPFWAVGGVLLLAILVTAVSLPYDAFRGEKS